MRFQNRDQNVLAGLFFGFLFLIAAVAGVILFDHMPQVETVESLAIAAYALIMLWVLFNTIYFFHAAMKS